MMTESEKPGRGEHLRYLLTAYVFESISEAGRREVEEHLGACAECRAELEELRETVASVEDAFAGEAGGAAAYSFEARRLERVLAAGRGQGGASGWLARWRSFRLAAAAVILIGIGVLFLSPVLMRGRMWAPIGRSSYELARRAEAPSRPAPAAGAVPASPPMAERDVRAGDDRVQLFDDSTGAAESAGAVAALPSPEPTKEVTLWAAPEAKPAEVAFEQAPGAGGAGGGVTVRARALPRREGDAPAGPATPPPPATEPATAPEIRRFAEVDQTTDVAQAGEPVRVNENMGNFGAELRDELRDNKERAGVEIEEEKAADRRGGKVGKPQTFDLATRIPGVDGFVSADDTVVVLGRSDPARQDGAAAASAAGTRDYREKLEEDEVTKLATRPQTEADEATYYRTELKRDVSSAGEKQVVSEMETLESRSLDVPDDFLSDIGVVLGDLDGDGKADVVSKDANAAAPGVPTILPGQLPMQDWGLVAGNELEGRGKDPAKNLALLSRTQTAQGWSYAVELDAAAKPGLPPPDPSAMEGLLRGYAHYHRLDPGLALDEFAARSLEVPAPAVGDEGLGQKGFRKRHGVNPFVDTRRDHFSTFGMDVDTASYTLARGALAAGKLPDPRHIRVEEFVNYFPEDIPASKDRVFSVRGEGGPSPFGEGLDLLKLTVKARDLLPGERKDAVLTFAVDTSGSMHEGDRLALVREALATLVRSLKPDDRVAVVGFSDNPYLVLPHTPAREADRILGAVASLTPRGDTNFEAGLALAYRVADEVLEPKAVHRVILCSDGVATAGARGADEILKRVEVFAKRGIYLSCVGFGMGKYNDRLLETLADRGNGNYAYADDLKAAAEVFRRNLPATLQVLAQDAKIQVDFNPDVVSHYRLVGYENRDIADKDFRNDKVDAGEVGPGTTVTVLYEVLRRPGSSGDVGRIHVRYRDTGTGRVEEESHPLPPGVVATRLAETSDRFRFIACAAETAELLRGSYWARNGSYGKVLGVLHGLGAEIRNRPEWKELAGLAARAQALTIRTLQGK